MRPTIYLSLLTNNWLYFILNIELFEIRFFSIELRFYSRSNIKPSISSYLSMEIIYLGLSDLMINNKINMWYIAFCLIIRIEATCLTCMTLLNKNRRIKFSLKYSSSVYQVFCNTTILCFVNAKSKLKEKQQLINMLR